jgi:hypothetical protein
MQENPDGVICCGASSVWGNRSAVSSFHVRTWWGAEWMSIVDGSVSRVALLFG